MNRPKLVIFDMDGLMIDTEPLAIQGWKTAAKELDIPIPDDIYPHLIGLNRELCKTIMFQRMGTSFDYEAAIAIVHRSVDSHFQSHGVPIKPGLLDMLDKLDKLKENGVNKCVATSTATARATHKLTLANIAHRFHAIIGGDQVPHSKPAPDIFLKAAAACNTAPKDCIVLEDSNAGAQGGISAGMSVIIVPDLLPPNEANEKKALAVCKDLYHAWDVINCFLLGLC